MPVEELVVTVKLALLSAHFEGGNGMPMDGEVVVLRRDRSSRFKRVIFPRVELSVPSCMTWRNMSTRKWYII